MNTKMTEWPTKCGWYVAKDNDSVPLAWFFLYRDAFNFRDKTAEGFLLLDFEGNPPKEAKEAP